MKKMPHILVTNDDGITAPGIRALVEVAKKFGKVTVVAPDSPQSGQGHAITIDAPLRINKMNVFEGVDSYSCSGTPVDCVKLGNNILFKNGLPDLCVSGINHGSNAAVNILYSGTMSAAMEASLEGIPSIGFSLLDFKWDADFTGAKKVADELIYKVLQHGLGGGKLMNVNVPNLPASELKGMKICRQGKARWIEEFQEGVDPRGKSYYWLTGKFVNQDPGEDSDVWALENGYASIVPSMHDLTDYTSMNSADHFNKNF